MRLPHFKLFLVLFHLLTDRSLIVSKAHAGGSVSSSAAAVGVGGKGGRQVGAVVTT